MMFRGGQPYQLPLRMPILRFYTNHLHIRATSENPSGRTTALWAPPPPPPPSCFTTYLHNSAGRLRCAAYVKILRKSDAITFRIRTSTKDKCDGKKYPPPNVGVTPRLTCVTFLSHTDTFYQQLHSDLLILTRGRPSRPKRERCVMALQRSGGGGGGGQPGAKQRACCVRWWLKARAIETFRHRLLFP